MVSPKRKPQTIEAETVFMTPAELRQEQERLLQLQQHQQMQTLPANLLDESFDDDVDIDDVTALNNVLAELGVSNDASKGFITVFKEKIASGTKTEDYLGKYAITEYANGNLLDHLQNNFGGGRYHVRVYKSGGRGMVIAANKFIDIAGDPKTVTAAVAPGSSSVDLTPILAAINAQNANFERLLGAMVNNQPKPKTTLETLEEMRVMRDVFAPAGAPATPPATQFMEAMKMGMEMAAMNSGGDGNNAWALKAMETFGKPIMEAVMAGQIAPQMQNTPRNLPAPKPAQVQTENNIEDDNAMNLMMKGYFKMLQRAAAQNEPVDGYADTVLSLIPENALPEFEAMLRSEGWLGKLKEFSPSVTTHTDWFTRLRNMIIEFIDSDRQEAADLTGGNTGDSVNSHENDITGKSATNHNPSGTP